MNKGKLNRRTVLGLLGAYLPAHPAVAAIQDVADSGDIRSRLVALFTNRDSAAVIGIAYLATRDDTPTAAALVGEYIALTGSGVTESIDALSANELRQFVHQRAAQDFSAGRTVRVDGWVLSESEARVFAMAALD